MRTPHTVTRVACALSVALLASGCEPPPYVSESGALEFLDEGLGTSTGQLGFVNGDALLVNTPVCAQTRWADAPDSSGDPAATEPADCAVDTLTGATWDGECFVADTPGQVVWSFDLASCPGDPLPDTDEFRMPVAAVEDVSGQIDFWVEDVLAELELDAVGDVDAPLLPPPHTPVRVLADTPTGFDVRLFAVNPDDSTRRVAFRVDDSDWAIGDGATVSRADPGYGEASVPAGADVTLGLVVGGHTFDAGRLIGTPPDDVVSLSAVGWQGDQDTLTGPIGVRAVGRTADGEPVFGLPVQWSVVKGSAAVEPGAYAGQAGYATVSDACLLPSKRGGPRSVTLRAKWAHLASTVTMSWEGEAGTAEDDASFVPADTCDRGCGCASAPTSAVGGLWLTGMAALVARRRRRA